MRKKMEKERKVSKLIAEGAISREELMKDDKNVKESAKVS